MSKELKHHIDSIETNAAFFSKTNECKDVV